ncbi:hypothetical protein WAJ61_21160, partial [Acinetobacter baumannii]
WRQRHLHWRCITGGAVSLKLTLLRISRRPVCRTNDGGMIPPGIVLNIGGKDAKLRLLYLIQ